MQVLTDEYALDLKGGNCSLLGESAGNLKQDSSPLLLLGESTAVGDSGSSEAGDAVSINEVELSLLLSSWSYSGVENSTKLM